MLKQKNHHRLRGIGSANTVPSAAPQKSKKAKNIPAAEERLGNQEHREQQRHSGSALVRDLRLMPSLLADLNLCCSTEQGTTSGAGTENPVTDCQAGHRPGETQTQLSGRYQDILERKSLLLHFLPRNRETHLLQGNLKQDFVSHTLQGYDAAAGTQPSPRAPAQAGATHGHEEG